MKLNMVSPREAILLEDIEVHGHIIKSGFRFDGASIPKAFWWLIGSPFTGKYRKAALLHDVLYASELYDRKTCDKIFLEVMKESGVNWVKRRLMYSSVRLGGRFVWNKHDEQLVQANKVFVEIKK